MVSSIRKRDARIVPFDVNKIAQAIFRAASSQGGKDYVLSLKIAAEVLERLNEQFEDAVPDVEQVQDLVENSFSGHIALDSRPGKTTFTITIPKEQLEVTAT